MGSPLFCGISPVNKPKSVFLKYLILFSIKNRIKNPLSASDAFNDLDSQ